jgi:carbamoyltransferase
MDILGINFSPDAAAAFLRKGEVLAAVTDERFTGKKHSRDFPTASMDYCLRHAGVDLGAVDVVALFWNPGIHLQSFNVRRSAAMRHHGELLTSVPNHLLARYPGRWEETQVEHVEQVFAFRGAPKPLRIVYVTHHHAHAASAFFVSPFEEAAILTVDGYGEKTSVLMGDGRDNTFRVLKEIEFPHSLGAFYAAVTQYLGFTANYDEGKVMGLAAHGEARFAGEWADIVRLQDDGGFEIDLSYFAYHQERPRRYSRKLLDLFGPDRAPDEPLEQRHKDFAASAQKVLEDALIHLARHLRHKTGQRKLCLAGGVALNCVANSRILEEADFEDAFIQPAAGDNGTSLGAALYVHHQLQGQPRRQVLETDALGPAYGDDEIERELLEDRLRFERCDDIARVAAERLVAGDILGWFQGRMEFGPRALGHRSILADPRRLDVKEVLDRRVKRREPFRPYAPSVLLEAHSEYFTGPGDSPFMIKSFSVRPEKRDQIPGVVHVDGSARVQTVSSAQNPLYFRLIKEFGRLTGVPMVLNTSFNGRGETMVCTVRDALRCFYSCGLDSLAIGSFLVRK